MTYLISANEDSRVSEFNSDSPRSKKWMFCKDLINGMPDANVFGIHGWGVVQAGAGYAQEFGLPRKGELAIIPVY